MAYDEGLAHRLRELLEEDPVVTEKKMFGGLCFLHRGICVAASCGMNSCCASAPINTGTALRSLMPEKWTLPAGR
jgi:hypothetical protein